MKTKTNTAPPAARLGLSNFENFWFNLISDIKTTLTAKLEGNF